MWLGFSTTCDCVLDIAGPDDESFCRYLNTSLPCSSSSVLPSFPFPVHAHFLFLFVVQHHSSSNVTTGIYENEMVHGVLHLQICALARAHRWALLTIEPPRATRAMHRRALPGAACSALMPSHTRPADAAGRNCQGPTHAQLHVLLPSLWQVLSSSPPSHVLTACRRELASNSVLHAERRIGLNITNSWCS